MSSALKVVSFVTYLVLLSFLGGCCQLDIFNINTCNLCCINFDTDNDACVNLGCWTSWGLWYHTCVIENKDR